MQNSKPVPTEIHKKLIFNQDWFTFTKTKQALTLKVNEHP